MSPFSFRPAKRTDTSLLISLAGGTGSGKTMSAMRLATGLSGDKPFAFIDTECGRSSHYADMYRFEVGEIVAPFRPDAYMEAIKAADKAGYPVIVIDSFSHSWAGEGGILDWHEEELARMAGDDWKKRESMKVVAWIRPKMAMKAVIQRMLQVRAHLIFCLRAEQKIEMSRGSDGRMVIVPRQSLVGLDGWIPICSKEFPFEMTASFLLTADKPGVPKPIKLQEQHRPMFPLDKPITEESGARLAAWARGGSDQRQSSAAPSPGSSALPLDASADWLTLIGDANTEADLKAVGERLSEEKGAMPADALANVRKAYGARMKALSGTSDRVAS